MTPGRPQQHPTQPARPHSAHASPPPTPTRPYHWGGAGNAKRLTIYIYIYICIYIYISLCVCVCLDIDLSGAACIPARYDHQIHALRGTPAHPEARTLRRPPPSSIGTVAFSATRMLKVFESGFRDTGTGVSECVCVCVCVCVCLCVRDERPTRT